MLSKDGCAKASFARVTASHARLSVATPGYFAVVRALASPWVTNILEDTAKAVSEMH